MGRSSKSNCSKKQARDTRKKVKSTKENPFEVRVNKLRYDILGRKLKHEKGNPGISRSKGIKKREKSLLLEYKKQKKANIFIDRRFGEYDESLSLEEKMLKRFAAEKQKHHEKTGMFNLEDEDLTHFGQTLEDIKHFDGPIVSDDESGEEGFKDEHNFGGFLERKTEQDPTEPRSKKEIMDEIIANAKVKKHERQVAREEAEAKRQSLDEGLESIRNLLKFRANGDKVKQADDYDVTVREMAFEVKARASDKMKSEEQIAKMEEERLQKLESERIKRMKGFEDEEPQPRSMSADALVDCYSIDTDIRSLLSYRDGRIVLPQDDHDHGDGVKEDENNVNETEEENNGDDDGEDDGDDDGDDDGEDDGEDEGEDEEDEEEISSHSDIESDHESSDGEMLPKDASKLKSTKTRSNTNTEDLPYTFAAPESFEQFYKLVEDRSTHDMLTIVERIRKCNHPKLDPRYRSKMEDFFTMLLKYIDDHLLSENPPCLQAVDGLISHLFHLAQEMPLHAAKTMQARLVGIRDNFCKLSRKRKVPDLKTVVTIRIVSALFSTSDFRHVICTPVMLFMGQILSQISVVTLRDVFIGLFMCTLVHEFVRKSKRYVPEVINYLTGVLFLASEKTGDRGKLFPPFNATSKHVDILRIGTDENSGNELKPVSIDRIFMDEMDETDCSRETALYSCLVLLMKFTTLYDEFVSFYEIFQPAGYHLKRIPAANHSPKIQCLLTDLTSILENHSTERQPLTMQTRRPKAIQMFEPQFDEHYEVRRKHTSRNKQVNERQKLRYKHKKEFKGALREIRKDSQFLARQQLQEQSQRDAERALKTKKIQAMLSNQQAEANEFNRKKRKKRA